MWRTHPLHASAFLVNQNRGLTANRLAQLRGQRAHLIRAFDMAGKEDEPERNGYAKERLFFIRQSRAGAIQNSCAEIHRVTTGMHSARSATKAEQNRRASERSSNPAARSR